MLTLASALAFSDPHVGPTHVDRVVLFGDSQSSFPVLRNAEVTQSPSYKGDDGRRFVDS